MDLFSDSDNLSYSSGSEEQDEVDFFYGGHACSILSSLEESIGKIDNFLSFERRFVHGDIVVPSNDSCGQMGKVINISVFVNLENHFGKIMKEVSSRKIRKVRSLSLGDYIVLGPWVGKVDKIIDCVTILFDDGTKSEFTITGPQKIMPISPDFLEDSEYQYYPGQRVRVEVSSVSKPSKWLCGTKEKQDEGTVFSVEAGLVSVDWLACALVGNDKAPVPPFLHDSKKLTLLSCFSQANWQLGDWCILPNPDLREFDLVRGYKHAEKVDSKLNEMFVITKTKTIIDVMWQDGTCSFGLDSQYVVPVNFVDAHDFWPDQFVMEKGNCDDKQVPSDKKLGIVRSVNAKERTARVNWKSIGENKETSFEREQSEDFVSAYELVEHPDYSYSLGDVVFRSEKKQSTTLQSDKLTKAEVGKDTDFDGEQNILLKDGFLSSIGIVIGFKAGLVKVKWATGDSVEVAPYEILRMDKYECSSPSHVLAGDNVEQLTQEVIGHEKHPLHLEMKVQDSSDSSVRSLSEAAVGIFTSIMGSLFGSYTTSSSSTFCSDSNLVHELASDDDDVLEPINPCTKGPIDTYLEEQVKNIDKETAPFFSAKERFKRFDLVNGCLDHHFVDGAGKGLTSSQVRKGWLKKIQQEWSILENDLPETIYVRAYEERMDLLRAVIIGAPTTPYHDGLFFFDIFLPPEYPHEPPSVHYNSGGLRVNPNLYESGKECLSLLNTWTGTETEVWNTESSTILQILVSLQALVLNEKPYFNEAGYDKQMGRAEAEKNSVSYNENAFLVSCKSMLYLLRKPPKHFEAFVEEHFTQRSKNILSACKAYMEGAPIGCAFENEIPEIEKQEGSSKGFKIMLSKLYPKLVQAFSEKGIDCSPYEVDPAMSV